MKSYHNYFSKTLPGEFEIIVISDGCSDRSPEIVKEFALKNDGIVPFRFSNKLGKGGAIIKGIEMSTGTVVGFTDADESVVPGEYGKLVKLVENGSDCAIASRRVKGAKILEHQPAIRQIASKMFNVLVNGLFGLDIRDTQCGAKAFKGETIRRILPDIRSTGFNFDVDLLWKMKLNGYAISEIPIKWKHEPNNVFHMGNVPSMFFELFRIRWGNR